MKCNHCYGYGEKNAKLVGVGVNFKVYQCPYCQSYFYDKSEFFVSTINSFIHKDKIAVAIGERTSIDTNKEILEALFLNIPNYENFSNSILYGYETVSGKNLSDYNYQYLSEYIIQMFNEKLYLKKKIKFITNYGEEELIIDPRNLPNELYVHFKNVKISMILKPDFFLKMKLKKKFKPIKKLDINV